MESYGNISIIIIIIIIRLLLNLFSLPTWYKVQLGQDSLASPFIAGYTLLNKTFNRAQVKTHLHQYWMPIAMIPSSQAQIDKKSRERWRLQCSQDTEVQVQEKAKVSDWFLNLTNLSIILALT